MFFALSVQLSFSIEMDKSIVFSVALVMGIETMKNVGFTFERMIIPKEKDMTDIWYETDFNLAKYVRPTKMMIKVEWNTLTGGQT